MAATPASRRPPPEDAAASPASFPNAISWFAATCQQPARAPAAPQRRKGAGLYACTDREVHHVIYHVYDVTLYDGVINISQLQSIAKSFM